MRHICCFLLLVVSLISTSYAEELPLPELERKALAFEAKGRYRESYETYLAATEWAIEEALKAPGEEARRYWAAAEVYLHRTQSLFSQMPNPDYSELATALSGLNRDNLNPVFRGYLNYWTARTLLRCGRAESARQVADSLGMIRSWFIIGPFDNEQGIGFNEPYPPEEEINLDGEYKGKRRKVKWRRLPFDAPLPIVDLDSMLRPNDQVLAYAVAFVYSPEEQDAALRLGTDEGFKLFFNGKQIEAQNVKRRFEFDQNVSELHLRKGWNIILLKVTELKGEWRFCARLTAPDGSPLDGLEYAEDFLEAKEASSFKTVFVEPKATADIGARGYYQEVLKKDSKNFQAKFELAYLHMAYHWEDETVHKDREYLEELLSVVKENAILWFFASQAYIREIEYETEAEENRRREYMLKAVELDRNYVEALHSLAEYYLNMMSNWEEANSFNERALKANPNYVPALTLYLDILQHRRFDTEAECRLKKMYERGEKGVSDATEVLRRMVPLLQNQMRYGELKRVCRAVLGRDATLGWARSALIERLSAAGDTEAAEYLLEEAIRLDPYDTSLYIELAKMRRGLDRLEDAASALEDMLEVAPEDEQGLSEYAKLLMHISAVRGEPRGGEFFNRSVEVLKRLLVVNPNTIWARRYLEFIGEREKPYEELERFIDTVSVTPEKITVRENYMSKEAEGYAVKTRVTEFSVAELDKEAEEHNIPIQVLLSKRILKVNKNGTSSEFHYLAVRIATEKGVEMLQGLGCNPFTIGWGTRIRVKEARIIHRNGDVEEAKINGSYIEFPNRNVGDVCEFYFRADQQLSDISERYFGDYFGAVILFNNTYAFNQGWGGWSVLFHPVKICKLYLILPIESERKIFYHLRNIDAKPSEEPGINPKTRVLLWRVTDLPEVVYEQYMPPPDQIQPVMYVSSFEDWNKFGKWFSHLTQRQFESSEELRKEALKLTKGCKTDMEKVRALYNFVTNKVRYQILDAGIHGWKPYKASTIFQRKIGDCKDKAILFCTMMKEVGLKAYLVIIRAATSRGKPDLTLPMVEHFNHCIAYVPKTETTEEMWLDLTAQGYSFKDSPPEQDRGTPVLVVMEEESRLKNIDYRSPDERIQSIDVDVVVKEDGSADMEFTITMSAYHAMILRVAPPFVNEGLRKMFLEQRVLARTLAGSKVSEIKMPDLTNPDINPIVWSFKVKAPSFVKKETEGETINAFVFPLKLSEQLAQAETRRTPVSLPIGVMISSPLLLLMIPGTTVEKYTFKLEKHRIRSLPEDFSMETLFGKVEVKYIKKDAQTFTYIRRLTFKRPYIEVKEYGKEFRDFLVNLDEQDEKRVVIEKIEEPKKQPRREETEKPKEKTK